MRDDCGVCLRPRSHSALWPAKIRHLEARLRSGGHAQPVRVRLLRGSPCGQRRPGRCPRPVARGEVKTRSVRTRPAHARQHQAVSALLIPRLLASSPACVRLLEPSRFAKCWGPRAARGSRRTAAGVKPARNSVRTAAILGHFHGVEQGPRRANTPGREAVWERLMSKAKAVLALLGLVATGLVVGTGPVASKEFTYDERVNTEMARRLKIPVYFAVPASARLGLPSGIDTSDRLIDFKHPD